MDVAGGEGFSGVANVWTEARRDRGTGFDERAGMVEYFREAAMNSRFSFILAGPLCAVVLAGCGGDDGPTGPSGPPVITSVNGATLPTGPVGGTVIVEGMNFGSVQGGAQVLFTGATGGTVPAVIVSAGDWTDVFIVTTVPSGAESGDVVVQTSVGTSNAVPFALTQNAPFSPSTVSWTQGTDLSMAVSGLAAAWADVGDTSSVPVVYAIGGADDANAPQVSIDYAMVGAGGALGAWTSTTPLPQGRAFASAVVAGPNNSAAGTEYLYVLGGATNASGDPSVTVYRAPLDSAGAVGTWAETRALPVPLRSFGATVVFGSLYVVGGATTGNVPVATVYRSTIGSGGELGAWETMASLPFPRAHFGFGHFAGRLYAFGGDSSAVAANDGSVTGNTRIADVVSAGIDFQSRSLVGWQLSPSKLTKTVLKHTAVVAGGNVLSSAGLYNGAATGATEQIYAQLNGDGTTGSFNGATGSNTIASLGGGNLFNHAAIGYLDPAGAFHVLLLGGDDVNSPGTKRAGVFYY